MSEITEKMADELYEVMCRYVGANHKEESVKAINFTLTSMEVTIKSLEHKLEVAEGKVKELKANHADLVMRNAALRDRPDIPTERVKSVQALCDKIESLEKIVKLSALYVKGQACADSHKFKILELISQHNIEVSDE